MSSLYSYSDEALRGEVKAGSKAAKKSRSILEERLGDDAEHFIRTGEKKSESSGALGMAARMVLTRGLFR